MGRYGRRGRHLAKVAAFALVAAVGVLLLIAIVSAFGLGDEIAGAYFAATGLVLPESWHDEWRELPAVAHVAIAVVVAGAVAAVAGELLDFD